jgi:hypothetical protein
MKNTSIVPLTLASLGACVLSMSYFLIAIEYAGPFSSYRDVRLPVALLLPFAYFVAIYLGTLLLQRILARKTKAARLSLLLPWAVVASALVYLAPLLPFLLLTIACKTQALCPEAANPIAWALHGIVIDRGKPFASVWAVPAIGVGVALSKLKFISEILRGNDAL